MPTGTRHADCRRVMPRAARAAWLVPVACAALLTAGLMLAEASGADRLADAEALANVSLSLGFSVVGALIVSRRPRNRLGLLYLGVGFASAMTVFAFAYGWYGLVYRPGSVPAALAAGWVSAWVWTLGFSPAATFGLLLFPDGRLPSPRWRSVAALPATGIAAMLAATAFSSGPLANHTVVDNPLGVPDSRPVLTAVAAVGFPLVIAGILGGIASLVVRWRRGEPGSIERRRITLLVVAALATLGIALTPGPTDDPGSVVLGLVVMALIPAAVGVAILRHRLYDIDIVLNRSLVYGALTGIVLLVYVAAVAMASRAAGSEPLLPGLIAAGAAIALLPLRGKVQRAVNQLMYGESDDPYQAVSRLADRLSAVAAPGEALDAVVENVRLSLRLPYVAVEVDGRIAASSGDLSGLPDIDDELRVPLVHQGVSLGELLVGVDGRRGLDARRRSLLSDLVRQAAPAVLAARLTDAVQLSRQELIAAREEERRRIRRDLHDGLGPTLAGVALGIDVAVGKLDVDPDGALAILRDVKEEANAAVEDVRRIAYGMRPPALDELGLVGALSRAADHLSRGRTDLDVTVHATALDGLHAATEVAAYRIGVEAMANAVKHSGARRVAVTLTGGSSLLVEVCDDGAGVPADAVSGVGVTAMRERATELGGSLELATTQAGTTVCARLPLVHQ